MAALRTREVETFLAQLSVRTEGLFRLKGAFVGNFQVIFHNDVAAATNIWVQIWRLMCYFNFSSEISVVTS
jgi:hypothetical protein